MTWLILVVAVVLVVLTVAAAMGRIDGSLAEPVSTQSYVPLPLDRLTPDDIEALRLDTALRGYRMDQVDDVIGRLSREIRDLAERVEQWAPSRPAEPASGGCRVEPASGAGPGQTRPASETGPVQTPPASETVD